jgi:translocation and assembly module TamA
VGEQKDGSALGGLSLVETSIELRLRFGAHWGGVLFLDGGTVYEGSSPGDLAAMEWGAGFGIRYFTGLGPLRLDLAAPVEGEDRLTDDIHFYVSLGQSF